ncbi:MAG TPA: hypothetical protein VGG34_07320 [Opitutaceae bacterium]|jgi:hypothetical protein
MKTFASMRALGHPCLPAMEAHPKFPQMRHGSWPRAFGIRRVVAGVAYLDA